MFKHDPGPCPVDDAPHTTCTSPDYDTLRYPLAPMRDGIAAVPTVGAIRRPFLVGEVPAAVPASIETSTLTYGRGTPRVYNRKRR
jgi:hypothetical protein